MCITHCTVDEVNNVLVSLSSSSFLCHPHHKQILYLFIQSPNRLNFSIKIFVITPIH